MRLTPIGRLSWLPCLLLCPPSRLLRYSLAAYELPGLGRSVRLEFLRDELPALPDEVRARDELGVEKLRARRDVLVQSPNAYTQNPCRFPARHPSRVLCSREAGAKIADFGVEPVDAREEVLKQPHGRPHP
jgi:hypothetical protein